MLAGAASTHDSVTGAGVADSTCSTEADVAAEKDAIDVAAAREERGAGDARRLAVVGQDQLDEVNEQIAFADAKLAVAQGG